MEAVYRTSTSTCSGSGSHHQPQLALWMKSAEDEGGKEVTVWRDYGEPQEDWTTGEQLNRQQKAELRTLLGKFADVLQKDPG